MKRTNGNAVPTDMIPNVRVDLNDDQRQKVWAIMGGMLDRENAIFELGKNQIDPWALPLDMKMEKAFLRIFYLLNHDRSPSETNKNGTGVVVTTEEMRFNLGLEFPQEQVDKFITKIRNHRPEVGQSIHGVAKGLAIWMNGRRGKQAFLQASEEFDGGFGDDMDMWTRALEIVNKAAPRQQSVDVIDGDDVPSQFMRQYQQRRKDAAEGKAPGPELPWGLDKKITNIKKAEMMVVSGKSSMGKSTIALRLAEHWAHTQGGYDVAYFFMETRPESQLDRIVSPIINVTTKDLRDPRKGFDLLGDKPKEKKAHKLFQAWEKQWEHDQQEKGRIWLIYCPDITAAEFEALVATYGAMAAAKGRELIAEVDYYSLLSERGLISSSKPEWEKNDAKAGFFKRMAKQYNCYMVVYAQDNMNANYANNARKTSKNGSVLYEQCQVWLRISREYAEEDLPMRHQTTGEQLLDMADRPIWWHKKDQPKSDGKLIVEKGSDDETGAVLVKFNPAYYKIAQASSREVDVSQV